MYVCMFEYMIKGSFIEGNSEFRMVLFSLAQRSLCPVGTFSLAQRSLCPVGNRVK